MLGRKKDSSPKVVKSPVFNVAGLHKTCRREEGKGSKNARQTDLATRPAEGWLAAHAKPEFIM